MKKVLVINASARLVNSQSRKLTEVFVDGWKGVHDNSKITFRELGNEHVPHIDEEWVSAASKQPAARTEKENSILKTSNIYIAELREADIIVLGSPMYNWSIPSTLKAFIDQVLRVNETFKVNAVDVQNPYTGLLQNKTLYLLLSRGGQGYEKGEPNEHLNFQSTYLRTVFGMMGFETIHVIAINGASLGAEQLNMSANAAHQAIRELLTKELV